MTWQGNVSNKWNDPLNWNPHGVPLFSQDVIIPFVSSPAHFPFVNVTGLSCKSINIHSSSMMTVQENKKLEVKGD